MLDIRKKIVTDECARPIAVQIDYADWLEIERRLETSGGNGDQGDLRRFSGTVRWGEDAVAYQRRVREDWPR